MSQRDPLGRESYNELMSEWVETRNAMLRMQGGILHPPAYLSPVARLLGYAWRIAVVLIVVALLAFLFVRNHVRSNDFSDMVIGKVGAMLGASEAEASPFRWKRSTGISKTVTLKGSDGSFFLNELKAEGFRFKLPVGAMFGSKWELEDVFISDLTVDVRPGGVGAVPQGSDWKESDIVRSEAMAEVGGSWGINPDVSQISFDKVEIANANFNWGVSDSTRGSLKDAIASFGKTDDGIWQLEVTSGKLSQNYLKNLELTALKISFHNDNTITFSDGEFEFGEDGVSGKGTIEGNIKTGDYPEFDIKLKLERCDVQSLLTVVPQEDLLRLSPSSAARAIAINSVHDMLLGRISGTINVTGSTNSRSGIKTSGALRFSEEKESTLRMLKVKLFEDLGGLTGNGYLTRPEITSGTLTFVTSEGMFTAPAINLQLAESARLMGDFSFGLAQIEKRKDTEPKIAPVPGVPILEQEEELPVAEFSGVVQFGVLPSALDNVPETVQKQFFPEIRDEFIWMNLPLVGPLNKVTEARGREVVDAVRAFNP